MILLPPSSTLFPYTTLFRSFAVGVEDGLCNPNHLPVGIEQRPAGITRVDRRIGLNTVLSLVQAADNADRKSTRLNSSHLGISYAVFCLKKKKNKKDTRNKRQ